MLCTITLDQSVMNLAWFVLTMRGKLLDYTILLGELAS